MADLGEGEQGEEITRPLLDGYSRMGKSMPSQRSDHRGVDACYKQARCSRRMGSFLGDGFVSYCRKGCGPGGEIFREPVSGVGQGALKGFQQNSGKYSSVFLNSLHCRRRLHPACYPCESVQFGRICRCLVQCKHSTTGGKVASPSCQGSWRRRTQRTCQQEKNRQRQGTTTWTGKEDPSWTERKPRGLRYPRSHFGISGCWNSRKALWTTFKSQREGGCEATSPGCRAQVGEHRCPLIGRRRFTPCVGKWTSDGYGSEEGSSQEEGEEGGEVEKEEEEGQGLEGLGGYKRQYYQELAKSAGFKRRCCFTRCSRRTEEKEEEKLRRKDGGGSGEGTSSLGFEESQKGKEQKEQEGKKAKEEEERWRPIEQWGDQLLRRQLLRVFGDGRRVVEQRGDGGSYGKEEQRKAGVSVGIAGPTRESPIGSEFLSEPSLGGFPCGSGDQDPQLLPSDPETAAGKYQWSSEGDVRDCDGLGSPEEGPIEPSRRYSGCSVLRSPSEPAGWKLAGGEASRDPLHGRSYLHYHGGLAADPTTCEDGSQSPRPRPPRWRMELWVGKRSVRKRRKRQMVRWRMERASLQRGKRKGERQEGQRRRSPKGTRRQDRRLEPRGDSSGEIEDGEGLAEARRALFQEYESGPIFTLGTGRRISWEIAFEGSTSLSQLGCIMSWMVTQVVFNPGGNILEEKVLVSLMQGVAAKNTFPQYRRKGEMFPFRVGRLARFCGILLRMSLEEIMRSGFVEAFAAHSWTLCLLAGCGMLAGARAVLETGPWSKHEEKMVLGLYSSAKRRLARDCFCTVDAGDLDPELASKRVGYNGDEVASCQPLSVEQVFPALPPEGHGGSINALDWLGPCSKDFLLHPEKCLIPDPDLSKARIPGRVHVKAGEKLVIARELVRRKVCQWIPLSQEVRVQGVSILNGLFGVEKPSVTNSGKPVLRLIMNLVPSNLILKQLKGKVQALPSINSWQSTFVDQGEELRLFQSDMSSAFYLFRIPDCWHGYLAFNIIVDGREIGEAVGVPYALACSVLPMGWASSVGLMQEISENILIQGGLLRDQQVRRGNSLPPWMCDTLMTSRITGQVWWHVYLDNFCACEKLQPTSAAVLGDKCHQLAEELWSRAGVVSSEKKRRRVAEEIEELGAEVDGKLRTLGGSAMRMLKIAQLTVHLLSKPFLNRKHVQILAGRWVFLMQFRRPAMSIFNVIWSFIGGKLKEKKQSIAQVREELALAVLLLPVMTADLAAPISEVIGASDASTTGGAVSISSRLTNEGRDFVGASQGVPGRIPTSPILVISLFNGIGGCFRCYDIIGIQPRGRISFDLCREANRIVERRWPGTLIKGDVRDINLEMVEGWRHEFGDVEEVHLWGGFPCVDLSRVKAFRKNLDGPQSSLFWEIPRIKGIILAVFQGRARVKHLFENVASMDREAAQTISENLQCQPYKVDCVQAVPMRRPRLAWCSESIEGVLPGVNVEQHLLWKEVTAEAEYPPTSCWLEPGTRWLGEEENACFPTCMKAIVQQRPPPRPAGIEKCDEATLERWRRDEYRYPPYQYRQSFVIMGKHGWRLLSAVERELLLGYGYRHTSLCLPASLIKSSKSRYEDIRCSLLGDSFSIHSFVIFAYVMSVRFVTKATYKHLVQRMGLAPGFLASPQLAAPICRKLVYGSSVEFSSRVSLRHLNELLLRNTDHTGSDVRIISGETLGQKIFPRQSVSAQWWVWEPVFKTRWKYKSHINLLELEAIILGIRYQTMRLGYVSARLFHISDSYVCISIVSKGRSSSRLLQRRLKYLAALLLASNVQLVLAHVESIDNPTDEASRS